jgi:hypothetical protein
MVETPVGARCPECARLYKLPTYEVSGVFLWRAIGAAFGMAIVCGLAWGTLSSLVNFVYLSLVFGAATGYGIGEVTSLAVNRKRGSRLAVIGGLAAAGGFTISILPPWGSYFSPFEMVPFIISLASVAAAIYLAAIRLKA